MVARPRRRMPRWRLMLYVSAPPLITRLPPAAAADVAMPAMPFSAAVCRRRHAIFMPYDEERAITREAPLPVFYASAAAAPPVLLAMAPAAGRPLICA